MFAVLLVSCTQSPQPSPSTSGAASPSPTSSLKPIDTVGFSCRLPVSTIGPTGTMTGGFVGFPSGNFTADPEGMFTRDQSTGTFRWLSNRQPQLIGSVPLLFYDRPMSRWLPTNSAAVYPDGIRYAYITGVDYVTGLHQTVHIVDVSTGSERVFAAPHPFGAGIFAYTKEGIYLAGVGEASDPGVWLLDPQKGSERLVTSAVVVLAVGNGKAWLGQLTSSKFGSAIDTLVELDLGSGSKKVWVHRKKPNVNLIGLTSDWLPVVEITGEGVSLFRSPGVGERIYSGDHWLHSVGSDAHGIWFESYDGIYLYSRALGFHRVSGVLGSPTGPCV